MTLTNLENERNQNAMFDSILASTTSLTAGEFLTCTLISLGLGVLIALIHSFRNEYSKNMLLSLIVFPAMIQIVIMLVNGNIGTGLAVMGAFSLVRFRSNPGNSREITSLFLSTVVGLAMSMGFVGIAVSAVIFVGLATIVVCLSGISKVAPGERVLKITIPENFEYDGLFDDLFRQYASSCELIKTKTVNMGSLYELTYRISLKKGIKEKEFIDQLRCRNGNLTIVCGIENRSKDEL